MFCNNCGKEIDENAVVCPYCGSATDKMADIASNTSVNAPKAKTNVLAIVGLVLALTPGIFNFVPNLIASVILFFVDLIVALTLSIVGLVFALKKGYNLKNVAIAGIVISAIDLVFNLILLF